MANIIQEEIIYPVWVWWCCFVAASSFLTLFSLPMFMIVFISESSSVFVLSFCVLYMATGVMLLLGYDPKNVKKGRQNG